MLKSIFSATSIPLLEKVAKFGEKRQEVIAGNIANIDTPGYRRRDLPVSEFQAALQKSVSDEDAEGSLGAMMLAGHSAPPKKDLDTIFSDDLFEAKKVESPNMSFPDGNNRSVESEVMEMTKNSMMQSYALELMSAQFNLLQAAITERP